VLFYHTVVFIVFMKFGREVLDAAAASIKPGVTADEIDRIVHEV
jgi:methionine aminopeptidase